MNELIPNIDERINRIISACKKDRTPSQVGVRMAIESILREQDRETRLICAEAARQAVMTIKTI